LADNSVAPASIADLAGFPVSLDEDGSLRFGPGVMAPEASLRRLEDASPVLLYPGEEGPSVLYAMYRGTGFEKDRWTMESQGIRYDITVIFPGTIGSEYVKTVGHYHPRVPGQPWTYPEIYQVLKGRAHFLLQKGGEISGEVSDFVVADFSAGDILLIPPFYGHVTTNPGDEPLVMANFIASEFQSVYDPVRLRKGLAFYDVEYKGESIFMPNDSYGSHPKPRLWTKSDYPELGLRRGESMYSAWKAGADLSFLRKPDLQKGLWESLGVRPED
jgi:glucose-6-phosphate isomerase